MRRTTQKHSQIPNKRKQAHTSIKKHSTKYHNKQTTTRKGGKISHLDVPSLLSPVLKADNQHFDHIKKSGLPAPQKVDLSPIVGFHQGTHRPRSPEPVKLDISKLSIVLM